MISYLPIAYMVAGGHALLTSENAWHWLNWRPVLRKVKSLQSRIVKAVKAKQFRKRKALQSLLSKNYAAKLLAIRRITENRGKRTPGIDEQKWDTPKAKYEAIAQMQNYLLYLK